MRFPFVWLVLLVTLLLPTALFAQSTPLTPPSSLTITYAEAYNNILETGDQLYLVAFDIFYADPLDRPAEMASSTMLVRLSSSAGIHGVAVPTSFVYRGYVQGIAGFYFANSDADKPTWGAATLVARIEGNASLSWVGGQPVSNLLNPHENTASSSTAQQAAIVTFLRTAIPGIENNWKDATGVVTDLITGNPAVLTATGEEYFKLASPHQRNLTPMLYSFEEANPDIVSYGRTTLTQAAIATATTITVSEASRTGIAIGQRLTIIGASVWETVTVTNVVGDVVTFTPALTNGYAVFSEVWITSPVLQGQINTMVAGSFLAYILSTASGAFGMSAIMFGSLVGLIAAVVGGGFIAFKVRGSGGASLLIGTIGAFVILLLFTFIGFVPVVVLGLVGTLLVVAAAYQIFWKWG